MLFHFRFNNCYLVSKALWMSYINVQLVSVIFNLCAFSPVAVNDTCKHIVVNIQSSTTNVITTRPITARINATTATAATTTSTTTTTTLNVKKRRRLKTQFDVFFFLHLLSFTLMFFSFVYVAY